jgi:hypothetical protein
MQVFHNGRFPRERSKPAIVNFIQNSEQDKGNIGQNGTDKQGWYVEWYGGGIAAFVGENGRY